MRNVLIKKLVLGASCAFVLTGTAYKSYAQDNPAAEAEKAEVSAIQTQPVPTGPNDVPATPQNDPRLIESTPAVAPEAAPAPTVVTAEPAPAAAPVVVEAAPAPAAEVAPAVAAETPKATTKKKKKSKKSAVAVPAPIESITPPSEAAPHATVVTSLREAVGAGIRTNPEYGIVSANRRATDEELNQAKGLYLPSIDVRADTGYEYTDNPATRSGTDDDTESMWRYQAGVTLTQMLFDGFETRFENERQMARVLSASNRVREAAELNGLSVVEAYLEVLRQREILKIADENIKQHMSLLDQIKDSASAGRTTNADSTQADARLNSARATAADVRAALRSAEADYIQQVGRSPENLQFPPTPSEALNADVESAVKTSLHQSPTIDIYEADFKVAQAETEKTKSVFYPQLDAQLNARNGNDLNGIEGEDTSASALVVLNWNLYRGGIDTARTREHINRESQAKETRAKAARGIENDVRKTWATMVAATERQTEFEAQARSNADVVVAYKDQFDLNRRTLLDVLDSQNELFVSRTNAVNARYVNTFAVYRLIALKGELMKTIGVEYPRESDPKKF